MKRIITLVLAAWSVMTMFSQTLNIVVGEVTYAVPASQAGDMVFSDGTSISILNKVFSLSEVDRMYVDNSSISDNMVDVVYNGTTAAVKVAGNVAQYLTVSATGADVSIVQSADLANDITYNLSGTSTAGSFYMDGELKASLVLNGLTLTSTDGAPINIQDGKRIAVELVDGTTSTLVDCSGGTQKGCFVVKGHCEFSGGGTLNITGKTAHGLWSKEYVQVKASVGAINILGAVSDGINCNQYYQQNGGAVTISGVGDDGIQVSYETDDNDAVIEDDENTGEILIQGGNLTVTTTGTATKGLNAEGNVTINETKSTPVVNVTTKGGGTWDSDEQDAKTSACISSDANVEIDAGTITLTNSGAGGKCLKSDGTLVVNAGSLTATNTASAYSYSGTTAGPGGGGFTPPGGGGGTSSTNSSYAKAIRITGNLTINGGTVTASASSHEGLESKAIMTINGGIVKVTAYDDAINAASDLIVTGGYIYSYSQNNDGLDANGNMYLKGGHIASFASSSQNAESGIDIDEQHKLYITGGEIFGIGGRVDATIGSATQAYGSCTATCSSGGYFVVSNGTTRIFAVKAPAAYSSKTTLISSSSFASGSSYTVSYAASSAVTGTATNDFIVSPTVSSVSSSTSFTASTK